MIKLKRYDKVWREESYETVKDVEGPFVLFADTEKLRKKIFVCYLADVVQYSPDAVTIAYDGKQYTIKKPTNVIFTMGGTQSKA